MYRNRRSLTSFCDALFTAAKSAAQFAFLLIVVTASGQVYENGPVNGTVNAWAISHGFVVANSFTPADAHTITGFEFYVWAFADAIPLTVDWAILSSKSGLPVANGRGTAQLADTFLFYGWWGAVRKEVVSGLNVRINPSNDTYWLVLQNAKTTNMDFPLYWDENGGAGCQSFGCPSKAWDSAAGAIPSESFVVHGCRGCICVGPGQPCAK
jgi:hypothetical protein